MSTDFQNPRASARGAVNTTCMDCAHWSPQATHEAMTRLGHAACAKRPTPGLTFGAHARVCLRYVPTDADTAAARHEQWDVKKAKEAG